MADAASSFIKIQVCYNPKKGVFMGKEKELIQRSLVVCKPDAVQRGLVGEILQRFENGYA